MKLRLHRNSVRLRLSPADVDRLLTTGQTEQVIAIAPGMSLFYSLRWLDEIDSARAAFAAGRLCVEVPARMARHWAESDQVSWRAFQEAGEGKTLEILVEKDFECLEGENVSQEVLYQNPGKICQ